MSLRSSKPWKFGEHGNEVRQDSRHYGWVFFALSLSNGFLGYMDARAQLTTTWDNLAFPAIMALYLAASIAVTLRPRWIEPVFCMTLLPTTVYQAGIVYLSIHHPDVASYYSAASGSSYFPLVYVGLFIVSAERATLYSTLHCSAFFALAIFNWASPAETQGLPLHAEAEHLLNAILLSHPIYILALRYIVRLRERLHQANRAAHEEKAAFLSMLSHEIRNQLQTMVIAIDQLDARLTAPSDRRPLGRLHASADQLQTYLADVGELTKLENPALKLEFETFEPQSLLESIRDEWAAHAQEKGLALSVLPAEDRETGWTMLGDRARLRQILVNLVSNALKYTEKGGVALSVRHIGDEARIEVRDTGIGIPADQQERIFQPRVRLKNDLSTDGSGLGLAIVARLASSLGARVDLNSGPGEGATFTLILPVRPEPQP